jgi:hypothetical protein
MAKFAFMINSAPGDPAPIANNLEYASNLDSGGHEVAVFFDGQGTQWIPELEGDTDSVALEYYEDVRDRGLVGGACGYCASFFEVDDEIEQAGIALDGGVENHGPDISQLANEGYQLINVG